MLKAGDRGASAPVPVPSLPRRSALAGVLAALTATPAIAATAVPAVAPSALPPGSIAALGRTIAALWEEHDRLDNLAIRVGDPASAARLTAEMRAVYGHAVTLSAVAMNARAATLADATVQVALAAEAVSVALACEGIEGPNEGALMAARHGLASVALLLTGADRARLADLGPLDFELLCLRAFPRSVAVGA